MERRRLPRIRTRFLVRVDGLEDGAKLRRGDISRSGICTDLDCNVGEAGTVQRLHIASPDGQESVTVMAQVVRVITTQDLWKGQICAGAAFQFMPEREETANQLDQLVRHLASFAGVNPDVQVDWKMDAHVQDAPQAAQVGVISRLTPEEMVFEANWPLRPGEVIRCEVMAPSSQRAIRLEGQVVTTTAQEINEGETRFRASVRFQDPAVTAAQSKASVGASISDAVSTLMDDLLTITHVDPPPRELLVGALTCIPLGSLLAFLEMERLSGTLDMTRGSQRGKVYVREGRVVDATLGEPPNPEFSPRTVLADMMRWRTGKFEFNRSEVDRPDQLNISTTGLLLDLARQEDEANR